MSSVAYLITILATFFAGGMVFSIDGWGLPVVVGYLIFAAACTQVWKLPR